MQKLPEALRAVAFDLDGTLVDTAPDLASAVNRMLGSLGARPLPPLQVRGLVGHGVERLVERALLESTGVAADPAQMVTALAHFERHYGGALFEQGHVYAGVRAALHSLQHSGLPLCCITNKDSRFALPLLAQADLERYFAFTLCADVPEDRKPSGRLLLRACERFGITPAEMLYVGDSTIDIEAAGAAGCPMTAVSYGYGQLSSANLPSSRPPIDSLLKIAGSLTALA
jgi:phosphoglycolate phosphatase